jgi:hypothetical protein
MQKLLFSRMHDKGTICCISPRFVLLRKTACCHKYMLSKHCLVRSTYRKSLPTSISTSDCLPTCSKASHSTADRLTYRASKNFLLINSKSKRGTQPGTASGAARVRLPGGRGQHQSATNHSLTLMQTGSVNCCCCRQAATAAACRMHHQAVIISHQVIKWRVSTASCWWRFGCNIILLCVLVGMLRCLAE